MRVSTRFPLAVHTLMIISAFSAQRKINSYEISKSTGVNAVIIRNIFTLLKKANLISISPGPGGATLAKTPEQITLLDIFTAVETEKTEDIFRIHTNPSPLCPVGSAIYELLYSRLDVAASVFKKELSKVSLADLINDLHQKVPNLSPVAKNEHSQNS